MHFHINVTVTILVEIDLGGLLGISQYCSIQAYQAPQPMFLTHYTDTCASVQFHSQLDSVYLEIYLITFRH